ncbi:response regulator [Carboxylicivirga sp. RSCT41]|uniref:response regulator n=1 Tax=Carboxylicivirga agarovorans TaxID=3417570 RepID=UPI003D34A29E
MKIAIVDDHPLFSEGLKFFLLDLNIVEEVVVYNSGIEFLRKVSKGTLPDIIFMDILMPGKSGVDTSKECKQQYPQIKIIAITSLVDVKYIEDIIYADVNSLLLKDSSVEEIETALKATANGHNYFSPKVSILLTKMNMRRAYNKTKPESKTQSTSRSKKGDKTDSVIIESFTDREMEVFKLICSGVSRSDIAKYLYISEKTVDKHRESLMSKTGSENLVQLTLYGLRIGIVKLAK